MTDEPDKPVDDFPSHLFKMAPSLASLIGEHRAKYPDPPPIIAEVLAWQARTKNYMYICEDPVEIARLEAIFEKDELVLVTADAALRYELSVTELFLMADIQRLVGERPEGTAYAAAERILDRIKAQLLFVPESLRAKYAERLPTPAEILDPSHTLELFVELVRRKLDLQTDLQTHHVLEAVLSVFRWRLDVHEAMVFRNMLPPFLRGLFWDASHYGDPQRSFDTLERMNREVREEFWPDISHLAKPIEDVAAVLWKFVDRESFELGLSKMPPGAKMFWWSPR